MRWIFVTLVLLNLLYFGWGYWQQTAVVPEQKPAPVSQVEPQSGQALVLLTERLPAATSPVPPPSIAPEQPKAAPVRTEAPRPQAQAAVTEPEHQICARIGPYHDEKASRTVVQTLSQTGLKAAVAETQEQKSVQFWVVLPPAESRRRALQTLRELQARKIDSYLITSGELNNAISLGLFNRDALAKGVQQKIGEAGYPAEIRHKEKLEKVFWVLVAANQPIENARKVLDDIVSEEDGIKITNTPCEMFAQSN